MRKFKNMSRKIYFFEPKSAKAEVIKKEILNDLKNLSFDTFLYKITEIIRKRKAERA